MLLSDGKIDKPARIAKHTTSVHVPKKVTNGENDRVVITGGEIVGPLLALWQQ